MTTETTGTSDQSTTKRRQIDAPSTVFAACLLSAIGAVGYSLFPILLTEIAGEYGLGDAELGLVGGAYMSGAAVIALLAPIWVVKFSWRISGPLAAIVGWFGLVILARTDLVSFIYVGIAFFGAGSAAFWTLGMYVLSHSSHPERGFGIAIATELALAGTLAYVTSNLVIPQYGFAGLVFAILLLSVTGFVIVLKPALTYLKTQRHSEVQSSNKSLLDSPRPAWLAALVLFLGYVILSSLWAFAGRIGASMGLSATYVGSAVSLSMVAAFGGAVVAAAIGNRFGHIRPLTIGYVLLLGVLAILAFGNSPVAFLVGISLLNALVQYNGVFQMGLIAYADGGGRLFLMVPFMITAGSSVGPAASGFLVEGAGFSSLYAASAALVFVVFLLSLQAVRTIRD